MLPRERDPRVSTRSNTDCLAGGNADGTKVVRDLSTPDLDALREVRALDPGAGGKDSGESLAAGIREASALLAGQKRNKTNMCKIVVFVCTGAAASPLEGAAVLGREVATGTTVEVM